MADPQTRIWIDIETYHETLDVTKVGAWKYAEGVEIMLIALAQDQDPVSVWDLTDTSDFNAERHNITKILQHLVDDGCIFVAHNCQFERACIREYLGIDIPIEQWEDTAVLALMHGYPHPLGMLGEALHIPADQAKDREGKRLIQKFCKPRNPSKNNPATRWTRENAPEDWQKFIDYCRRDVEVMRQIADLLPRFNWTETERNLWYLDQRINERGLPIDTEAMDAWIDAIETETARLNAELNELTGGAVSAATKRDALLEWLADHGPRMPGLTKYDVSAALDSDEYDEAAKRALQIRQQVSKTSNAKFKKLRDCVCRDGRMRGTLQFCGAFRTGRWCLDKDTRVSTARGLVPICKVQVGDRVLTHKGRYRPVDAVFFKGFEVMYKLTFRSGMTLTCTKGHRILTTEGWKHVAEIAGFKQSESVQTDPRALYVERFPDDGGGRERVRGVVHDGPSRAGTGTLCRGIEEAEVSELRAIQVRRQKPDERSTLGEDKQTGPLSFNMESGEARVRRDPSKEDGRGVGPDRDTYGDGGSPHRRESREQFVGQSRTGDSPGAYDVAPTSLDKVEVVGARGVWDLNIRDDHSFVAEGLIHHNSGRSFQPQNLPSRELIPDPDIAIDALVNHGPEAVKMLYAEPLVDIASASIRGMIAAPADQQIVAADLAGIEARMLQWLAMDDKGLQVFRDGRDVYKFRASQIFNVAETSIDKSSIERLVGKVAELALGYQGSVNAFRSMMKTLKIPQDMFTDTEIRAFVRGYREMNDLTKTLWYDTEKAAVSAMRCPGETFTCRRVAYIYKPNLVNGMLLARLPSGRCIVYVEPELRWRKIHYTPPEIADAIADCKDEIDLYAYCQKLDPPITVRARPDDDLEMLKKRATAAAAREVEKEVITYMGMHKERFAWTRLAAYGGKFVENNSQSASRDVIAHAMPAVEEAGYEIITTVHDEIVSVAPTDDAHTAEGMSALLSTNPPWCPDLPLAAAGFEAQRYRKD